MLCEQTSSFQLELDHLKNSPQACVSSFHNKVFIKRWNWNYQDALSFQKKAVEFIKKNREQEVYIITSHPHCFTHGRGLQKKQGKTLEGLIEFDFSQAVMPFPLHFIKRGGGLSFHYPGQWILYPIINLSARQWNLPNLMTFIFDTTLKLIQNDWSQSSLIKEFQEKAGIWNKHHNKKLASIGFALNHFVTYHGFALNFYHDEELFAILPTINPCGLNGSIYTSLQQENPSLMKSFSREFFSTLFIEKIKQSKLANS